MGDLSVMQNLAFAFITGVVCVIVTLLAYGKIRKKEKEDHAKDISTLQNDIATLNANLFQAQSNYHNDLLALKKVHSEELDKERKDAYDKGYKQAVLEYEYKSKIFGLTVRPYVEILDEGTVFTKKKVSKIGYQYQLLVNGVPAFKPHVIIEQEETYKDINKENMEFITKEATRIATAAIKLYLGDVSGAITYVQDVMVNKQAKQVQDV